MNQIPIQQGEILRYDNGGQEEFVGVVFRDETFWLPQKEMAELLEEFSQSVRHQSDRQECRKVEHLVSWKPHRQGNRKKEGILQRAIQEIHSDGLFKILLK